MKKGNVAVESRLMSSDQPVITERMSVYELDNASPFALLSIAPTFVLDIEMVKRNYTLLQETLHPDRYPHQTKEAEVACLMASAINQAYAILRDPLRRAKALLSLKGCSIPGEDGQTIRDPRFMEEALTLKELLEEAQTPESCIHLIEILSQKQKQVDELFQAAFLANDLVGMSDAYIRLSFIVKTKSDARLDGVDIIRMGDYAPSA